MTINFYTNSLYALSYATSLLIDFVEHLAFVFGFWSVAHSSTYTHLKKIACVLA